jgi:hypothetical protein
MIPVLMTQDIVEEFFGEQREGSNHAPSCLTYKQRARKQVFMNTEPSTRNGSYCKPINSLVFVPKLPREVFEERCAQLGEDPSNPIVCITAFSNTKGHELWDFNRIIGWAIRKLMPKVSEGDRQILQNWLIQRGGLTFASETSPIYLFCWELVQLIATTVTESFLHLRDAPQALQQALLSSSSDTLELEKEWEGVCQSLPPHFRRRICEQNSPQNSLMHC